MSLLSRLQIANYKGEAIRSPEDEHCVNIRIIDYERLIKAALAVRKANAFLQNKSIAIAPCNVIEFVSYILAFDGFCKDLYLMPDSGLTLPENTALFDEQSQLKDDQSSTCQAEVQTRWHLATSGTSGTPKWIAHDVKSLSRAIKLADNARDFCWGLCYQAARFAGLQIVLQAILSGARLIDCSRGDAEYRLAMMREHGVNALSATPSLYRQLVMTGKLGQLSLKQLTLGGEIADQGILDTLSRLFPHAKLLHIYASTEAGVGFAVSDKKAGFPASWLTQKRSDLQFAVSAQQHLLVKPPHVSEQIRSYLDQRGFIDTGDLVHKQNERVYFLGRASGVINVGGNKVHPEEVEQVLLSHPQVIMAKVYAKNSSVLGQLVACELISDSEDTKALKQSLIKHCLANLERYKLPAQFNFVSKIASNATGKLIR